MQHSPAASRPSYNSQLTHLKVELIYYYHPEVVFVTNVPGVLVGGALAPELSEQAIGELIADGTISGGMIPKVRAALTALAAGVRAARITNLAGLESGTGTVID